MRKPLSMFRASDRSAPISPHWQPALARQRRARRRPILIAASLGLAFAASQAIVRTVVNPTPRLVWNATASAPIGLYSVTPIVPLRTGDMVVARLPRDVAAFAARRHYLPLRVPLVKRIGAAPGDRVCAIEATITINGNVAANRLSRDHSGRPLPWWRGCTTLRNGAVFLLSPVPDSFDSRYFGPIDPLAIVGRAQPLWTRPALGTGHD